MNDTDAQRVEREKTTAGKISDFLFGSEKTCASLNRYSLVRGIIAYVTAVVAALGYMVYLDEESGLFVFSSVVAVPLISLALAAAASRTVSVKLRYSSMMIGKKEKLVVDVRIFKRLFLPVPFICFDLSPGTLCAESEVKTVKTSMFIREFANVRLEFNPIHCTSCEVGIKNVCVTDYLGMFKFSLRCGDLCEKIEIIPEIREAAKNSTIFDDIAATVISDDNSENGQTAYTTNSVAGYEHREYVGGDPLKRINWKLSSKRGTLMVRLDEAQSMTKPVFVIETCDSECVRRISASKIRKYADEALNEYIRGAEHVIENILGTLALLCSQGIECEIFHNAGGVNSHIICSSASDVAALAIELGRADICSSSVPPVSEKQYAERLSACGCLVHSVVALPKNINEMNAFCAEKGVVLMTVTPKRYQLDATDASQLFYFDEHNAIVRY